MKKDSKELKKLIETTIRRMAVKGLAPIAEAPVQDEEEEETADAPVAEPAPPVEEPEAEEVPTEEPAEEPGAEDPARVQKIMDLIKSSPAMDQINMVQSNKQKIKAIIRFSDMLDISKSQLANLFSQMKKQQKEQ